MPAQSGAAFLLKQGDGGSPPSFATLAGLRTTAMTINNQAVDITHKDSGGWREFLGGAGVRTVAVSGSGVFMDSAAEGRLRQNALTGAVDAYQLSFEDGSHFEGSFVVTQLDYAGDYNGERTYTLSLQSSGPVTLA